jgi:hypothetical protein
MTVLLRCHGNYVHCVMFIMSIGQLVGGAIPASLTAFSVYLYSLFIGRSSASQDDSLALWA